MNNVTIALEFTRSLGLTDRECQTCGRRTLYGIRTAVNHPIFGWVDRTVWHCNDKQCKARAYEKASSIGHPKGK